MTLKEKFLPRMYCFFGSGMLTNSYDEKVADSNAKECEKLAEDFAIGFAKFLINYNYDPIHKVWIRNDKMGNEYFSTKDLLEIYKKEQEL